MAVSLRPFVCTPLLSFGRFSLFRSSARVGGAKSRYQHSLRRQQHRVVAASIPGVKHVVAVASGKGGVGKSTTAVNVALALSRMNQKVAVVDADIYGPSIPRLLNLTSESPEATEEKMMIPLKNYGISCISMGFLVPEQDAMIWRGPMVASALEQLLRKVVWGNIDIMVVDLPPGTGDAQLTLTQKAPLTGAVVVSTPQDIALLDAVRAVSMFQRVDVPILGIVQNMSTFVCPKCETSYHIFGENGAKRKAEELGIKFLGDVPLDIKIRETSDGGKPIVISNLDSPQAQAYMSIAERILESLEEANTSSGPEIVFE